MEKASASAPTARCSAFFAKAKKAHGDLYDYSLSVYVKFDQPVKIICKVHGPFLQKPMIHTRGKGCPKCGHERRVAPRRLTVDHFVSRARQLHGESTYDYSQIVKVERKTRLTIICPTHGPWQSYPQTHLDGKGCARCGGKRAMLSRSMQASQQFVSKATAAHGNKYDYSRVEYQAAKAKVEIICRVHGAFFVTPANHIALKTGCPKCSEGNISAAGTAWLDHLGVPEREARIPGTNFKVDGLDPETRTVYEFFGCFWHGCPKCFKPQEINPRSKISYGELYDSTVKRSEMIKALGFRVLEKWSCASSPAAQVGVV